MILSVALHVDANLTSLFTAFLWTHNIHWRYVLLLAGYYHKLSLHTFWCLCTLYSAVLTIVCVYIMLSCALAFLLGKASFWFVTMQFTSLVAIDHFRLVFQRFVIVITTVCLYQVLRKSCFWHQLYTLMKFNLAIVAAAFVAVAAVAEGATLN